MQKVATVLVEPIIDRVCADLRINEFGEPFRKAVITLAAQELHRRGLDISDYIRKA